MKAVGIVLIVAGILMMVFTNINFTTEKKIVDVGPVEVDKKENNSINWPTWAGAVAVVAGAVVLISAKKKA